MLFPEKGGGEQADHHEVDLLPQHSSGDGHERAEHGPHRPLLIKQQRQQNAGWAGLEIERVAAEQKLIVPDVAVVVGGVGVGSPVVRRWGGWEGGRIGEGWVDRWNGS